MEYIGDVFYDYAGEIYANITNKCPCRCEFCIRDMVDSLGGADSLWLKREPGLEEIFELLAQWDLSRYSELVFCGYGEPTERLDDLLEIARRVKTNHNIKIRINTNGLADLINGRETAAELEGLIDAVSVSLNTSDPEKYEKLCHPVFGHESFGAIIDFTRKVKEYVPDVTMSVVGGTIPAEDVEKCRRIACEELGVKFRVR